MVETKQGTSPPSWKLSRYRATVPTVSTTLPHPILTCARTLRTHHQATRRRKRRCASDQCTPRTATQAYPERRQRLLQRTTQPESPIERAEPIRERIWEPIGDARKAPVAGRDKFDLASVAPPRQHAWLARIIALRTIKPCDAHWTYRFERLLQQ